ncbi:hypothetical protein O181_021172 [Austropuccinia psidii MF-1]|uniref:Phosphatidylinositol-specific phospholipase C X domain-containing protein n=1 Tax=Austropuccinia psidii MF-1 TaxID=1389203 RepID=A0A9Q3CEZ7_9BASI|nr:hypothetical protein [Austropuccinia psidii MF-1]
MKLIGSAILSWVVLFALNKSKAAMVYPYQPTSLYSNQPSLNQPDFLQVEFELQSQDSSTNEGKNAPSFPHRHSLPQQSDITNNYSSEQPTSSPNSSNFWPDGSTTSTASAASTPLDDKLHQNQNKTVVPVSVTVDSRSPNNYSHQCDSSQNSINSRILRAASILGFYEESNGPLSNWMSRLEDQELIANINLPGTHDSATWNYTRYVQLESEAITGKLPPPIAFQCQSRSLFEMLSDGIRFFDLRVGFLPGHQQLGFFHGAALLSQTAILPDVLLGFYKWLQDHPTETLLISIKVDNATYADSPSSRQPSNARLQKMLYEYLTQDELGKKYWLQQDSMLGTLGQARGKIIFIQRIDWDLIRADPLTFRPIGIPLPPSQFHVNDPNFSILYNSLSNSSAFIEDFYDIVPNPTSIQNKIGLKFQAVKEHLLLANESQPRVRDQLFITFASGEALRNQPPVTPKMLASGVAGLEGVNAKLKKLLKKKFQQQRLGIVVLDWYELTPGSCKREKSLRYREPPLRKAKLCVFWGNIVRAK